jgi:PRTRC genetic system protein E
MMFSSLHDFVKARGTLTLAMATDGDKLRVTVVPAPVKADAGQTGEPALNVPLQITGTPEELDRDFVGAVTQYTAQHASLAEQVKDTLAVIEAAKKEQQAKAAKAISGKKVSAKPPASSAESADDDDESDEEADDIAGKSAGNSSASKGDGGAPAAATASAQQNTLTANLFD